MINSQQLFIFGDSISCGVMYDESAGRYTLCRNTYDRVLRRQDVPVKNYAKPGCTAADAVRDLEKTEPLAGAQCIIEFGGNDSDLNWEDVSRQPDIAHKAKVSLADFRASLLRLIDYARANAMQPIIALPLPVVADRYFEWISPLTATPSCATLAARSTFTAGRSVMPIRRSRPPAKRIALCWICAAHFWISAIFAI